LPKQSTLVQTKIRTKSVNSTKDSEYQRVQGINFKFDLAPVQKQTSECFIVEASHVVSFHNWLNLSDNVYQIFNECCFDDIKFRPLPLIIPSPDEFRNTNSSPSRWSRGLQFAPNWYEHFAFFIWSTR
jgi:hypothetical protein